MARGTAADAAGTAMNAITSAAMVRTVVGGPMHLGLDSFDSVATRELRVAVV